MHRAGDLGRAADRLSAGSAAAAAVEHPHQQRQQQADAEPDDRALDARPVNRPITKPAMIGATRKKPPAMGVGLVMPRPWQSIAARTTPVMVTNAFTHSVRAAERSAVLMSGA